MVRGLALEAASRVAGGFIVDAFHWMWYRSTDTWYRNAYLGHAMWQCPLDTWLYQELVYRERPPFILQTGVALGGSILYFAHLLDLIGADPSAVVIGIDIVLSPEAKSLDHPRIHLIEGSSTDLETVAEVDRIRPTEAGLVVLDSDHSAAHVLRELELYSRFTSVGCHLVVEDANISGHPVLVRSGPGPFEAVDEFLRNGDNFVRDDEIWRRNLFSFHQYGWLRRVK